MELVGRVVDEVSALWTNFTGNILEWVMTIVLMVYAVMMEIAIKPKRDHAVFENFAERYPYSGETINIIILFVIIIIVPCALLGIMALVFPRRFDLGFAYMSLAQVLGLTLLLTESLKIAVARPRPNYFSYCEYDGETKVCNGSPHHQKDAKVSFPSGHASNAFGSAIWLSLMLGEFNRHGNELWFVLMRFAPLAVATGIAATRVTDYMHHVSDVVGGAILGMGVGLVVFRTQSHRIMIRQLKNAYNQAFTV